MKRFDLFILLAVLVIVFVLGVVALRQQHQAQQKTEWPFTLLKG